MSRRPPTDFAPNLDRAVHHELSKGSSIETIDRLSVHGAASLRGIRRLRALRSLVVAGLSRLDALRGHPALSSLDIDNRGAKHLCVDLAPVADLPVLRELSIYQATMSGLEHLRRTSLETLQLRFCQVPRQRLWLPATLVELELDATPGLRLRGVCPNLRLVDLWGSVRDPLPWLVEQPAIEELWLNGCELPSLVPLLEMPRPPRWVFMDGHDEDDLAPYREAVAALEARGTRFAFCWPHDCGIWIPSEGKVSPRECEPLYLSPGWPREKPASA